MKIFTGKLQWFFVAAALAVAIFPQAAYASVAVAQQVQGEVLVARAATPDQWEAAVENVALENGDSVKTNKGTCALVYTDQATFSLDENTTLTVEEKADSNDIKLLLGKIKGKVNKQKVEQPFQIATPAAVATVRGTEVDFAFNEAGQLVVDLHTGKIDVVNEEAEMKFDLEGKKSVTVLYDKTNNLIKVKNSCDSDGPVSFNILGATYDEAPCSEREVSIATGEQGTTAPNTLTTQNQTENPDEGREPISQVS